MTFFEIFLVGLGLSMDAFAVSVTNGMCKRGNKSFIALMCGLCFGVFQGVMPSLGYLLGSAFAKYIERYDHIIALVLLSYIGGKMVFDSFTNGGESTSSGSKLGGELIVQGIATSIDALAVGVSFSPLLTASKMGISALIIAVTTFAISFGGVYIGKKFGDILSNKAQLIGGIILIAIGLKIFVEHVFFS